METLSTIKTLLDEQATNFEAFKKNHDDKYNRLEQNVMDFVKKANRPNFGGGSTGSSEQREAKSDMANYIRSRGETKGMSSRSGPDGGWTVNPVLADGIGGIVRNASALRELITQFIPLETGDAYEEVISVTPVGAKWVGETEDRPDTATPKLVKITTTLNEEYAEPVLSKRLADDSGTAMVDFLVNECALSFAEAEETALFFGTGVEQPRGLDTIATAATADDTRAFGTIEHIPTGVSGDFAATDPFDAVKKVFYKLRAGYRKNAKWVCNSETALKIALLQDGQGNYLWDEGNVKDGTPPTLLGKPVVICETAPGVAANAKALWFGDWDQALRGIERPGNKLLLDPYTDKPNIKVYVYRRVGMQLRNSNALKCLKFSVS
jgi:HK97 family phage major capsid protein